MSVVGYWSLFVPSQTVGANLTYFDLWNGSNRNITFVSLAAIKDVAVAVSGLVSVQMFLTRTSAVGTGGTEDTNDGTSLTACTITKLQQYALPADISARLTPTGGATAGAVVCERHSYPEETQGTQGPLEFLVAPLVVPTGTGIRVVQGTVASVGKIGFSGVFY